MIRENVWREFVAVGQRKRQTPEAIAQRVSRDYVQRVGDEELLARSARAAQRALFSIRDGDHLVPEFRRRTKG